MMNLLPFCKFLSLLSLCIMPYPNCFLYSSLYFRGFLIVSVLCSNVACPLVSASRTSSVATRFWGTSNSPNVFRIRGFFECESMAD